MKMKPETRIETWFDYMRLEMGMRKQEHNRKKKEPVLYFVKNKFGDLIPTFKNPKDSFFWRDAQHGEG